MQPKTAFYPCCAKDIVEPIQLLSKYIDQICFCDLGDSGKHLVKQNQDKIPKPYYLQGDARGLVKTIKQIDVLFYRRDSAGEGGSALFVLGDSFLPFALEKFNPAGGFVITDGSNARGSIYKRMKRNSGYDGYGWHIQKANEQPFENEHDLLIFTVTPSVQNT
jgi:hypothetical protein